MQKRRTRNPLIFMNLRKPSLEVLEDRTVPAGALASAAGLRVVLVSDAVTEPDRVAAAALPGVATRVYSAADLTSDGLISLLREISSTHGDAPLKHLALVTHGDAGKLKVSAETTWSLESQTATSLVAGELRTLLAPGANLDLYVCNLAAGDDGQAMVQALATWTGAAVRASTNPVGSGVEGDFTWEFAAGAEGSLPADLLNTEELEAISGLILHDDGYEPNNSKAAVDATTRPEGSENSPKLGVINTPKTITGLVLSDEGDWYQFKTVVVGNPNSQVRIDFNTALGDLDLHVYRADGTTRVGVSETTDQGIEQVSLQGAPPGIYYARVFAKGTSDAGYQLRITPPSATPTPPNSTVLTTTLDNSEVSEAAGNGVVLATVSRTGSTAQALEVTLTSTRPGDLRVPSRVTIPAGAERVVVPVDLLDNNLADGTRSVTITAAASGLRPGTANLSILDNEGLKGIFFSQSAATGIEGSGSVRVTVVRGSVDADTGAVVIFTTTDGTARAGVEYTAASGALTLNAGELTKTITIPLADDNVARAARTFNVSLTVQGGGSPLLSPSRVAVTIRDNDLPETADGTLPAALGGAALGFANSREQFTNFVTKAYQTYLKRGPDPNGLNAWVELMLARRVTDERLESGFLGSAEYIQNNGGRGRGWVVGMYKDLLGRTPGESEVQSWLQAMANGMTEDQVAYGFAASAEREGQRVRENYRVYLERTPSQAEVDGYVAEFVAGRLTNEDVIARFIGSPEYYNNPRRGQGNKAVWVAAVYEQVLFRFAARSEVEGWVRALS